MSPGGLNSVACGTDGVADVAWPVGELPPPFDAPDDGVDVPVGDVGLVVLLGLELEPQPAARAARVMSAAALVTMVGRMSQT